MRVIIIASPAKLNIYSHLLPWKLLPTIIHFFPGKQPEDR